MSIGWPEGIVLALVFINLCLVFSLHGSPRTGNHNAGVKLFDAGLLIGLLYWGGFFA